MLYLYVYRIIERTVYGINMYCIVLGVLVMVMHRNVMLLIE